MGLALWMVLVPVLAAFVCVLVPARQACVQRGLALAGSVITLLLALLAWLRFPGAVQAGGGANPAAAGVPLVSHLPWFTLPGLWQQQDVTVGLSFGLDGLSLTLAGLTALLALLAAAAVRPEEAEMRRFALWSQLAAAGAIAAFTALDVLTFFAGLELSLFAGFFLIDLSGDPQRRAAAVKYLLYRGLASVLLLLALFGIAYGVAGGYSSLQPDANGNLPGAPAFTLAWPALQHNLHGLSTAVFPDHARAVLFWVLLLGILVEEAFVPFHTWLPTAHEHTSAPVSMLLGGVLTKTGAYALLRFGAGLLPDQLQHFATWVAVLGTINILYGAFAAWAQRDWRRLIAFGSISHMGLVLLATAAGNAAGLQGAMFMMVSSGLLTAFLFFLAGAVQARTQTAELGRLGGLSRPLPLLSGFWLVAALGALGLPLTSGFVSEIQSFIGSFHRFPAISFVAALGLILSAVYLLYAIQQTTFGPLRPEYASLADAQARELWPAVVLTAVVLWVGVYPNGLGQVLGQTVQQLLQMGG